MTTWRPSFDAQVKRQGCPGPLSWRKFCPDHILINQGIYTGNIYYFAFLHHMGDEEFMG